ncbi:Hcp family type VI secretion system effector [Novosphingobium beihaiensis]|uniref:Uncharacterized protein n=1 Tax=Novosphingobium beihaiensis TaxID=2930389 RepID=A0ABT0BTI1_9SPHN|nr:hypothetical protein [Novosphingobium beihaiensis]MCJ2188295.1 hypothetical protein [Novosphingobium beihaiensis]
MRRRTLALLPVFGIALAVAGPAKAGPYLRLDGVADERKGTISPHCAAADAEHRRWIDLLSVGSGAQRQATDGGAGHLTIKVRAARSLKAIKAMMACGRKLDLTLREGGRKYRLSNVSIGGDRPGQSGMTEIDTFTLTFSAIRREK